MPATSSNAVTSRQRANEDERDDDDGWLQALHEFSANMLLLLVGLHVSYMLLFRRPLALFMLFRPAQKQETA